jgi:RNA polymerase sigma-54 factor
VSKSSYFHHRFKNIAFNHFLAYCKIEIGGFRMDLNAGLWQQQTLKLAMTQELTQAITLLQYSTQELTEFIESKTMENPFVQVEYGYIQPIDPRFDRIKKVNNSFGTVKQNWMEQMAKSDFTLAEYLKSQLTTLPKTNILKKVLDYLIHSLDRNGYLNNGIEEVSTILQVSPEEIENALKIIQGLEPVGVGARNLQECLLLQVTHVEKKPILTETILTQHFTRFAEKKWRYIAKDLGVELKVIQDVFDFVQTLNPRPGSDFQSDQTTYIVPDVLIRSDGNGFSVQVVDEAVPKIYFNQQYFQQMVNQKDKQIKRFLNEKMQDYQWLMRSLEQRKETILKVTLKIVEKQLDFFLHGLQRLKPMTMKEVSDELGIHESTVSRTVREKYVQTPYGTMELKSFFSSTIKTTENEDTSSQQVKKVIEDLIRSENKQHPYSDQDLVGILKDREGIVVSRRTIAKYRNQMGILSSSKRKRFE